MGKGQVQQIIGAIAAIFLIIILAQAFGDIVNQINPSSSWIFSFAIVLIIVAVIAKLFR